MAFAAAMSLWILLNLQDDAPFDADCAKLVQALVQADSASQISRLAGES